MNPLTHFKKIRILPLLIAPAMVIIAVLAAVPARATPGCGTTNTNLLSPVPAGFFPDGLLDLMCRGFRAQGSRGISTRTSGEIRTSMSPKSRSSRGVKLGGTAIPVPA